MSLEAHNIVEGIILSKNSKENPCLLRQRDEFAVIKKHKKNNKQQESMVEWTKGKEHMFLG